MFSDMKVDFKCVLINTDFSSKVALAIRFRQMKMKYGERILQLIYLIEIKIFSWFLFNCY